MWDKKCMFCYSNHLQKCLHITYQQDFRNNNENQTHVLAELTFVSIPFSFHYTTYPGLPLKNLRLLKFSSLIFKR